MRLSLYLKQLERVRMGSQCTSCILVPVGNLLYCGHTERKQRMSYLVTGQGNLDRALVSLV